MAIFVADWRGGESVGWDWRRRAQIVGTTVKNVIGSRGVEDRCEDDGEWSGVTPFSVLETELVVPFIVVERKGAANRDQTLSGVKGNMNSIVLPASNGARRALTVPWIWWSGRTWSSLSFRE
jgi:hypothetical protein